MFLGVPFDKMQRFHNRIIKTDVADRQVIAGKKACNEPA
jgi:hypothetical protein